MRRSGNYNFVKISLLLLSLLLLGYIMLQLLLLRRMSMTSLHHCHHVGVESTAPTPRRPLATRVRAAAARRPLTGAPCTPHGRSSGRCRAISPSAPVSGPSSNVASRISARRRSVSRIHNFFPVSFVVITVFCKCTEMYHVTR